MMQVAVVGALALLGPEWDALFDAGPDLQSRRAWFEASAAAAMPEGSAPCFLTVRDGGRPLALLPMAESGRRMIGSLTTPYTVRFQPLLADAADARAVGLALGRHLRRWPLIRLEALDPDWPKLLPLLAGFKQAGLVASRFDHFGNWIEEVATLDWPAYLAARPGALRETLRRRGKAVARDGTIRFEIVDGLDGLPGAMAAYEAVYARSWKVPEPFPHFNATLLPLLAGRGMLRLAVMWQGEVPLAAQYWTVADGVATVLKLAHDDGAKTLSPGTVLTAHVIRTLLEGERVTSLDFGRGDDPYKQLWTSVRRQRIGVLLANPLRARGLLEIVRHRLGQVRRAVRERRGGPIEG